MREQIAEQIQLLTQLQNTPSLQDKLETAVRWISGALRDGLPVLLCGNGGSAADALHISGELVGRFLTERKALNVICLNANVSVLTAWSNDYEYESVFARQVEAHGRENGVLWGISTSGNSENVIQAFQMAKQQKMNTIALTGQGGGKLAGIADLLIEVPSHSTPRIQELHMPIYHYLCERVEHSIFLA